MFTLAYGAFWCALLWLARFAVRKPVRDAWKSLTPDQRKAVIEFDPDAYLAELEQQEKAA